MDEAIETKRHRRLQAGDAEGRAIELDMLFIVMMWSMVSSDDVDASVGETSEHRVSISNFSQGWVHLDVGVVRHRRSEHFVGEHEMMRGDLARHANATLLSISDGIERLTGAHVSDMKGSPRQLG